jgi:hypothetical protein
MQSDLLQKDIQMRRDIECNPQKYLSNTPGGVAGFCLPTDHQIPTEKLLAFLFSR